MPDPIEKDLWECKELSEQVAWCRAQLESGAILTDPRIWLSGAEPLQVIRQLRAEGLPIKSLYVPMVDADGVVQPRTLAWQLETAEALET